jgi:hypothetical protein
MTSGSAPVATTTCSAVCRAASILLPIPVALISTDNQLEINEFRDSVGAQFPCLSDPGRTVRNDLDIVEYTDPVHDPMVPHTFVLAPGREISAIYNGYWYWGRPTVEELHRDLREVMRNLRPDFDLGAPGLREAGIAASAGSSW